MAYEYEIGENIAGLTPLADLTTPVPAPASDPSYSVGSITLGDGTERFIGLPMCAWHWGFLTSDQRDALKALCPDKSAQVAIRTLKPDGTYADYTCVMVWPQREIRQAGRVLDFTLEFRQMVED